MKPRDLIARAIQEADKSYLFEDYSKQADAVLAALRKEYMLVPKKPSEEMLEAGKAAISRGSYKPTDLVAAIYQHMVEKGKAS